MYKGFSTSYPVGDQAFSFPEPLHIYDFKERSGTDANLTLSANGEVMILAFSEEAGENTDLYVSFRVNQDIYSSPIRLEGVNSEFREFSPSLSEDGRLLFFSSTRGNAPYHSNIYMSERLEDRKSTRLNSSHVAISYAVFCLKKKIIHTKCQKPPHNSI